MTVDRRLLFGHGLAVAASASVLLSGRRAEAQTTKSPAGRSRFALYADLAQASDKDQTAKLQKLIDQAAEQRVPLVLPPGRFVIGGLVLRSNLKLFGSGRLTTLVFGGGPTCLTALDVTDVEIADLRIDGNQRPLDAALADGLLSTIGCQRMILTRLELTTSLVNGLSLRTTSGAVTDTLISECGNTGLFSVDAKGLDISHNEIIAIGNNGIQIWRSDIGPDGTIISANRISGIKARAGGSGQNGNGINIFRAGGVQASGNRIADCAFSAIRSNAGANCQFIGNSCERLGEVALYAEFGFEGAVIANNVVDRAAQGISVTNFNEGGRLGIVSGNLIRNMFTREDSEDRRGIGIAVEADTVVANNVVESAPIVGILAGWGSYLRDVVVSGNVVRKCAVGIGVSAVSGAGVTVVNGNIVSTVADGAIMAMEYDRPTGPELVQGQVEAYPHIRISGNVST